MNGLMMRFSSDATSGSPRLIRCEWSDELSSFLIKSLRAFAPFIKSDAEFLSLFSDSMMIRKTKWKRDLHDGHQISFSSLRLYYHRCSSFVFVLRWQVWVKHVFDNHFSRIVACFIALKFVCLMFREMMRRRLRVCGSVGLIKSLIMKFYILSSFYCQRVFHAFDLEEKVFLCHIEARCLNPAWQKSRSQNWKR